MGTPNSKLRKFDVYWFCIVGDDWKENTPPPKSTPTPAQLKPTRNVEQNPVAAPIVDDDGGDDDGERDGWEDEDWGDMEEVGHEYLEINSECVMLFICETCVNPDYIIIFKILT